MRYKFKKLTGKIQVHKIAGFDIETYSDKNLFYMGSVFYNNNVEVFYDCEEMIEWILNNLKGYWVYATNLSFDFFGLFEKHLKKYPNKPIFRGGLIGAKVWKSKRDKNKRTNSIMFLDSLNYAKFSVEQLGKIIGFPKLRKPKALGKIPKNETEKKELETYNIRDSEITCKFVEWFQKGLNEINTSLEITIAKTSLSNWRRNYFDDEWFKPKFYINEFVRLGYYGGRTEAFARGKIKDVNYYDINSLYPYCMLNEMPNPNSGRMKAQCDYSDLQKVAFIECVVKTPDNLMKPLLPYRKDNKLIFPLGTFKGVWSSIELKKALQLGYKILEFGKGVVYSKTEKYFENYVLDLYEKRKKAKSEKSDMQLIYKLLMNSLYGKFGQKSTCDEWIHISQLHKHKLEDIKEFMGDDYFRITTTSQAMFIHVCISAWVTAYARLELYKYIENHNILYCDTDSVFTKDVIETSNELGAMKHEGYIKEGIIVKPKFYKIAMGETVQRKLKGAYKISAENFDNIILKKQASYQFRKFVKYKESLRRNLKVNEIIDAEKCFDLNDNKRNWFDKKFNPDEFHDSFPLSINDVTPFQHFKENPRNEMAFKCEIPIILHEKDNNINANNDISS